MRQNLKSLKLLSPAKVNLFFYLLSKRKDGYHEIATLMQTINLYDVLSFTVASQDQLSTNAPLSWDKNNLIFKALELFRRKTDLSFHVDIYLEKNIPMGAGLAGGSSNAATTLWALNELSGRPLETLELQKLGEELGSDIPFFFSQGRAICRGKGEIVENLGYTPFTANLALPGLEVSTPLVYKHAKITKRDTFTLSESLPLSNDLEKSVLALFPYLQSYKNSLHEKGFSKVVMTGSGSGFVCYGQPTSQDHDTLPINGISREKNSWYID